MVTHVWLLCTGLFSEPNTRAHLRHPDEMILPTLPHRPEYVLTFTTASSRPAHTALTVSSRVGLSASRFSLCFQGSTATPGGGMTLGPRLAFPLVT